MSSSTRLPDVPEVLYAIFSYLDPVHHLKHEHDQVYESRRSLALAARTCRGFAGPALDVRAPGRADMVGIVSDVVKRVFPLAASAFRAEILVMEED